MSQKGAYVIIKDSSKIVVMKERAMFDRKDYNPSVWCKCYQELEAVCDFILQGYLS